MNQEMTERIAETKELVTAAAWRERILSCQESGKTVTAWCEENGIPQSTYYRKLRMMREDILSGEEINASGDGTAVVPFDGYSFYWLLEEDN